jgi:hypothetical protein
LIDAVSKPTNKGYIQRNLNHSTTLHPLSRIAQESDPGLQPSTDARAFPLKGHA